MLETSRWEFDELPVKQLETLVVILRSMHDRPNIINIVATWLNLHKR